jgi:hypothetical protein
MDYSKMSELISGFVNKHYPKGSKNRGYAITILALFMMWLEDNNLDIKTNGKNGRCNTGGS